MRHFVKMALLATLLTVVLLPLQSKAAVKGVKLKNNQKITDYDLNNDGKKDTLLVRGKKAASFDTGFNKWQISINGKVCLKGGKGMYNGPTEFNVVLYKVSSSRIYLSVDEMESETSFNGMNELYQVKGNRLVRCCDFMSDKMKGYQDYRFGASIKSLSSDKMVVNCGNQLGGVGWTSWDVVYRYKSGKWVQQGNSYKAESVLAQKGFLTANRNMPLTAKPGGKTKAITLKSGDKVRLAKVCIKKKHIYVQFTKDGKSGWFMSPKSWRDRENFDEVMFAG